MFHKYIGSVTKNYWVVWLDKVLQSYSYYMLLLIEVTMHPRRYQVTTWYSGKWLLCIQDFLPDATAVKGSLCILTASGMPKTETIDWRLFFKCTAHTRSSKKKLWRNRLLQATAVRGYHAFKEKQVTTWYSGKWLLCIQDFLSDATAVKGSLFIMHPARPKAGHRQSRWTGEAGRGA
jgi:hypothetical protein